MNLFVLLAQADDPPLPGFAPMSPAMRERLIVLGAMVVVVVGVLFWILVIRMKPPRRPGQARQRHPGRSVARSVAAGLADIKRVLRSRERRSPAAPRRRNPTLAETHRLPPRRSDGPPAPAATPSQDK